MEITTVNKVAHRSKTETLDNACINR